MNGLIFSLFVNTVGNPTKSTQTKNKPEHWKLTLAIRLSLKEQSPGITREGQALAHSKKE